MNSTTKTILASINTLVLASVSYDAALQAVRNDYAAERLTKADAGLALAMAYVHHVPAYKDQRDAETGKPVRDSALAKKVQRDLKAITAGDGIVDTMSTRDQIKVPKAIAEAAAALWALCAEYEGASRLASTAIAAARSAK